MADQKDKPEGATEWGARREKPVIDATAERVQTEEEARADAPQVGSQETVASSSAEPAPEPRTRRPFPLVAALAGAAGGALVAAAASLWMGGAAPPKPSPELVSRIAALEAATKSAPAALAALEKRIAAAEAAAASLKGAADSARQAAEKADARSAAVETTARNAAAAAAEARDGAARALHQQPAPASGAAAPIPAPVNLKPLEDRIAALETRLGPVEAKLAQLPAASPGPVASSAVAVTAQATLQALAAGRPLGPELAALTGLGVEEPKLAALKPYADKPAPTAKQLADLFAPLAAGVARNAAPKPESVGDRLLAGFSRVVTVRRVGEAAGDDPQALAGRVEAALARGDLKAALAAWDRLPGPAKALSDSFGAPLKTRVAADDSARAILSEAMASLAKPKG